MLKIITDPIELFSNKTSEFTYSKPVTLLLEHSLISISKWEAKYHKPFLSNLNKLTDSEFIDYIRFMSLNNNVDDSIYTNLSRKNIKEIIDYINDSQTATTFPREVDNRISREIITSELIYYWMIHLNIPSEYQKWHINRLLNLIKICNIKGQPDKKMSQRDIMNQNRQLNALRRAKSHSRG